MTGSGFIVLAATLIRGGPRPGGGPRTDSGHRPVHVGSACADQSDRQRRGDRRGRQMVRQRGRTAACATNCRMRAGHVPCALRHGNAQYSRNITRPLHELIRPGDVVANATPHRRALRKTAWLHTFLDVGPLVALCFSPPAPSRCADRRHPRRGGGARRPARAADRWSRAWSGRISAIRSAEVRARVAGCHAEAGLYRRDGRQGRRSAVRHRSGAVSRDVARARSARWRRRVRPKSTPRRARKRYRGSRSSGVVARQDLDDASAQANTGAAAVEQAVAAVEGARLDLAYTTVRAPISRAREQGAGHRRRAGGQGEATHLTTVEQIDQVYVDFNQSMSDVEALRRQQASGAIELAAPKTQTVQVLYRGRHCISPRGHAELRGSRRGAQHGRGIAARGAARIRNGAAARDVRACLARAGRAAERVSRFRKTPCSEIRRVCSCSSSARTARSTQRRCRRRAWKEQLGRQSAG